MSSLPTWLGDHHALLVRLRAEGYQLGIASEIQILRQLDSLSEQPQQLSDPKDLARWLGPIFCLTADEQRRLPTVLETWRKEAQRRNRPKTEGVPARIISEAARLLDIQGRRDHARELVKTDSRIRHWIWLTLGLAILTAMTVWLLSIEAQPVPEPQTVDPGLGNGQETQRLSVVLMRFVEGIGLLAPTVLAYAVVVARRGRRRGVVREMASGSLRARRISLPGSQGAAPLSDSVANRAIQALRLHRSVPNNRLDTRRTLRATLAAGGWPRLRYGTRPAVPEHLLLIDRTSQNDHMTLFGDALLARLEAESVHVAAYEFDGDPRYCKRYDNLSRSSLAHSGGTEFIHDLASRFFGQRLIVLAEADGFFVPDNRRLQPWFDSLRHFATLILLTPKSEGFWGHREFALREAGFVVLPASSQGLRKLADYILLGEGAEVPSVSREEIDPIEDLAAILDLERERLTSDEPLASRETARLVRGLHDWLGREAFILLGTVALLPTIRKELTLRLLELLGPADQQSQLNEEQLSAFIRLPWLRQGRMPDWLRIAVINALPGAEKSRAESAVLQLLHEAGRRPADRSSLEVASPGSFSAILDRLGFIGRITRRERILYDFLASRPLTLETPAYWRRLIRPGIGLSNALILCAGITASMLLLVGGSVLLQAILALGASLRPALALARSLLPDIAWTCICLSAVVHIFAMARVNRMRTWSRWVPLSVSALGIAAALLSLGVTLASGQKGSENLLHDTSLVAATLVSMMFVGFSYARPPEQFSSESLTRALFSGRYESTFSMLLIPAVVGFSVGNYWLSSLVTVSAAEQSWMLPLGILCVTLPVAILAARISRHFRTGRGTAAVLIVGTVCSQLLATAVLASETVGGALQRFFPVAMGQAIDIFLLIAALGLVLWHTGIISFTDRRRNILRVLFVLVPCVVFVLRSPTLIAPLPYISPLPLAIGLEVMIGEVAWAASRRRFTASRLFVASAAAVVGFFVMGVIAVKLASVGIGSIKGSDWAVALQAAQIAGLWACLSFGMSESVGAFFGIAKDRGKAEQRSQEDGSAVAGPFASQPKYDYAPDHESSQHLRRCAGPWSLWAIGVGAAISGDFFGWNFALNAGGFGGALTSTIVMTVLYVCLAFSIGELNALMPRSDGAAGYCRLAMGPIWGLVGGLVQNIGYMALATSLVHFASQSLAEAFDSPTEWAPMWWFVVLALSSAINIAGAQTLFRISIALVCILILGLLAYAVTTADRFDASYLFTIGSDDSGSAREVPNGTGPWFPFGLGGVVLASSFTIWFYVGVEQISLAAEEARNPRRGVPKAMLLSTGLLGLAAFTLLLVSAGSPPGAFQMKDVLFPITNEIVGWPRNAVDTICILASTIPLAYGYSRTLFSLSRAGYFPKWLSKVGTTSRSPSLAILVGTAFSYLVLFIPHSLGVGESAITVLVNIGLMGLLGVYILEMVAFIVLRFTSRHLPRLYLSPLGIPGAVAALIIACVGLASLLYQDYFTVDNLLWMLGWFLVWGIYYLLYARFHLAPENREFVQST